MKLNELNFMKLEDIPAAPGQWKLWIEEDTVVSFIDEDGVLRMSEKVCYVNGDTDEERAECVEEWKKEAVYFLCELDRLDSIDVDTLQVMRSPVGEEEIIIWTYVK